MARLRIGEQLVREGLISREQLAEGLARQSAAGTKLVATLISLGYIEQGAFLAFLSRQPGIASIQLAGYDVHTLKPAPDAVIVIGSSAEVVLPSAAMKVRETE